MKFIGVNVFYLEDGKLAKEPQVCICFNAKHANEVAVEEMKWESTVAVVMNGKKIAGDFCGVSWPKELFDALPYPVAEEELS